MKELAAPAIDVVRDGRVRFHPAQQGQVYLGWMESIRPWCISRQLWWGHRIPVWYCDCGATIVAETPPERCEDCGDPELHQDEDVLDTWFSSALWPFATLGWPDETPDLRTFYPGDVNTTAREIIFLWVARMIMAGLELCGDIPFERRHHPLDRARARRAAHVEEPRHRHRPARRDRASTAPTRRATGSARCPPRRTCASRIGAIEEGRKLANKLWNVSRLILAAGGDDDRSAAAASPMERWILGADRSRSS